MDSPSSGNAIDGFHVFHSRLEISSPRCYHLLHGRRGGWEPHFLTVVVQYCVVLSEEGVLDQDLDPEQVREDGEGGGYYRGEDLSKTLIGSFECLETDRCQHLPQSQ